MGFKKGDRVKVTKTKKNYKYFSVGDTATLSWLDDDLDWWAEFDNRDWGDIIPGHEDDNEFCLQKGLTEFELLAGEG